MKGIFEVQSLDPDSCYLLNNLTLAVLVSCNGIPYRWQLWFYENKTIICKKR